MELQELKNIINNSIVDGTLTVTKNTLNSENINWLLNNYFPNSTLTLRNATVVSTPSEDFVRVTGVSNNNELFPVSGGSAQFGAEAKFYILDSNAELQLTSTAPQDWTFENSFPSLTNSYFNQFGLGNIRPTFKAASVDNTSENYQKGLEYHSGFEAPSIWGVMQWLLTLDANATMSGLLEFHGGYPLMTLTVEPTINVSIESSANFELSLIHHSQTFPNPRQQDNPVVVAFSQLTAEVEFSHEGNPVKIPISTQFSTDLSVLNFRIATEEAFDLALSEIAHLVGGVDLGEALPSAYNPLGLTLHHIDFAIGLRTQVLEYVEIGIKSQNPWEIIKEFLTIEEISMGFMVVKPLNSSQRQMIATLYGLVDIGGV
ncbi:MAG: hypothetical protein GDA44_02705, partial [Prochloron sp. SP5CPC1]|nr:hypothetical protein [Candidatus Paraprochloron terpiosi SP5CPC1]